MSRVEVHCEPLCGFGVLLGHNRTPSWCLVPITQYFAPEAANRAPQRSGCQPCDASKNCGTKSSYGWSPYFSAWCNAAGEPGVCSEFQYHSEYGLAVNASRSPFSAARVNGSSDTGANAGMVDTNQWTNMPNFAPSYHCGI